MPDEEPVRPRGLRAAVGSQQSSSRNCLCYLATALTHIPWCLCISPHWQEDRAACTSTVITPGLPEPLTYRECALNASCFCRGEAGLQPNGYRGKETDAVHRAVGYPQGARWTLP